MNNRFLITTAIIASCSLFVAGCGDTSDLQTPNTSTTPDNDGQISQNNFTLLFSPTDPKYVDLTNGTFTAVTADISVQVGDINNQLITGSHTIHFRTQWGLIDPSCTTKDGGCKVTWRSGDPDDMPANYRNRIVAYSSYQSGQETFVDLNGNGLFDDNEPFEDLQEPFININGNFTIDGYPIYDAGDIIIDTINGLDLTGVDAVHNDADGFFNGPNCAHSSLCSPDLASISVWRSGTLLLTGSDTFSVGGSVTGLSGTLVLQNLLADDLSITTDGAFTFSTSLYPGTTYSITVKTQPAGQTCTVTDGTGTVNGDVTSVQVNCI